VKQGASVAINGTCLTVTEVQKDTLSFDIMMETLRATNLGELGAGMDIGCRAGCVDKSIQPTITLCTKHGHPLSRSHMFVCH
jgi:riboflavin synthase alpha subunit